MKKIQIDTTQNVSVQYQLAGTSERMLALVIDVIALSIASWLISLIFMSTFPLFAEVLLYILIGIYSPLLETLNNGRTIGKMAMNLKVVKINGEQAEAFDYLSRWSTKGIEVYLTLGSLGGLVSYFSPSGQRLGDILANTVVIKQEKVGRLKLSRVTDLTNYEGYEAKYPQVLELNEDDVVLMHETLSRYKKHRNQGHQVALEELVKFLKEKLDIHKVSNSEQLIKQLIKDYVILTR
ncbi:MAG TPA: hypothetical protein DHU89_05685 [Flavobacteriales bacterium]|nr:hypothetical protein [Flavobacteriales bacterium]|tara:strand:+ start:3283 stop:3993 length:711 start_codon:yes stop_codon:yes gene_type:complete